MGMVREINNVLADLKEWKEKNDLINCKFTLPISYLLNNKDEELDFVHEHYAEHIERSEILKKLLKQAL
ncbi:hypothetical protein [Paraliobacillus sp. JSM ZJ581]|uniref:hypothetical protein n=1 Tax=Paraliobacillus sp. JSM ZJ581 TaxID=3342118 RepID=UPI0035A85170